MLFARRLALIVPPSHVGNMIGEDVCWVILHMHYDLELDAEAISRLVWTPKHKVSAKSVERIVERFENSGEVRTIHQHRVLPVTGVCDR